MTGSLLRPLGRLATFLVVGAVPSALAAQTDGTCVSVAERAGRALGFFITARQELGLLPADSALYWHLDTYSTLAGAAAARGARGTVVESLGKIWLFSIGPKAYRAAGGHRVAVAGPLPLVPASAYAAVYMEGVFAPGMTTVVHRHPGVEVWYTLEGSMCVETPEGKLEQRAGGPPVMAKAGLPMQLTGTGRGLRRSVVLILQDSALARSTPAHDWTPPGLCGKPARPA